MPAGRVWVVRDIAVLAYSGSLGNFSVYVEGGGVIYWIQDLDPIKPHYEHWEGRQVVPGGRRLHWDPGTVLVQLRICGYELLDG